MKEIAYTNARAKMVELMEEVNDTHEPIEITRRGKRSVVLMGHEDYKAIEMAVEMLKDPDTARELLNGGLTSGTSES